jgi:hypothetical protein
MQSELLTHQMRAAHEARAARPREVEEGWEHERTSHANALLALRVRCVKTSRDRLARRMRRGAYRAILYACVRARRRRHCSDPYLDEVCDRISRIHCPFVPRPPAEDCRGRARYDALNLLAAMTLDAGAQA